MTDQLVPLRDVELALEVVPFGLWEQHALDGELAVLREWVVEQLRWWAAHPEDRHRAYERRRLAR